MRVERGRGEPGMVSAELAVGLVTLLLVLSLLLGVVRVGLDRVTAISAASAVAREVARGGDVAATWARSRGSLPEGSLYTQSTTGGFVTVSVRVPVRGGVLGEVLPELGPVEAVARMEGP